ncbi:hypothetical protein GDO78_011715 [Eleutherodactylus coqui]|uniref:Platelet-derived growth factor receptor-like protein n=1 Tax=Eleutherodactylus coqui TaxID=57060 RepID=A0A8J6K5D2_ELECQ|nr:hypothetical protein GDO78_011715 [Eleutherodactylus coqui]
MKFWVIITLILVHEALQNVFGQPPGKGKHPKEPGENKIKPAMKKLKPKITKLKESTEPISKVQTIMTQVMDKGRFQKPPAMLTVSAGQSVELRCKGEKITWNYPENVGTFKDSRLRTYERPVAIQDFWRLVNRGIGHTTRISKSIITVEDFETIDAGYYICKAKNLRGQTTLATRVDRY